MIRLALALIAALLFSALPSETYADSKSKAKAPQKSESKVTTRAPAPPPPPAAPITAVPTAAPRPPAAPVSGASNAGLAPPADAPSTPENAGTITTDEARELVAAESAGIAGAAGTTGLVSTDPAPPVDPLSLIQPVRRAPIARPSPPAAAPQTLAAGSESATLFPIAAGPLAALLIASLAALALTMFAVRRAGHLHHLLHSPLPGEPPTVTSVSSGGAVPTRWTGRRFEPAPSIR